MKCEIKNDKLIITLDINPNPPLSKSMKTRVVAGTGGFQKTNVEIGGEQVSLNINAVIPAK